MSNAKLDIPLTIAFAHTSGRIIEYNHCESLYRTDDGKLCITYNIATYNGTQTIEETYSSADYTVNSVALALE